MGRRMKATKSGKYINPTDQARKEARKRELKKNKKQRLLVRVAVLKGKDPYQIIADLERLDRMEFDFYNPPPLNEKVLKDKRRKLKETWDRVCRLYIKEDKDKYLELKRMEGDYESKRNELVREYEAIKSAQEVNVEDIPLPSSIPEPPSATKESATSTTSGSILKKSRTSKLPPGCPPGLPPSIKKYLDSEDDDDDNDDGTDDEDIENRRTIRFSDQPEEKNKDSSNLQRFLKEIEQLSTDKNKVPNVGTPDDKKNVPDAIPVVAGAAAEKNPVPPGVVVPPQQLPVGKNVFFGHPPPSAPSSSLPVAPTIQPAPPILIPPPPLRPPPMVPPPMPGMIPPAPIRPANPVYNNYNHARRTTGPNSGSGNKRTATIEAKPQLRNLSADATRFMPLALRVRRDEKPNPANMTASVMARKPVKGAGYGMVSSSSSSSSSLSSSYRKMGNSSGPGNKNDGQNSKDDAYEQFMKEMQGFI